MERTQIYLGEEEIDLLDAAALVSGASRSELIRRAVRLTFGQASKRDKLQALQSSAGSLGDRTMTGAEYVDGIRGGVNERLDSTLPR